MLRAVTALVVGLLVVAAAAIDARAQTIGAPIRINAADQRANLETAGEQRASCPYGGSIAAALRPSATLPQGGYVTVWSPNNITSDFRIFARRLDTLTGALDPADIQLSTTTTGIRVHAAVAGLQDGGFVAAWYGEGPGDDFGIFYRRFNADGTPRDAGERLANHYVDNAQGAPSIAGLPNGGFVIAWQSLHQDGSDWGVFARRFAASGDPIDAADIQINTVTENFQWIPSVAALPDGGFVVAMSITTVGASGAVAVRRFSASGTPLDPVEVQANTFTQTTTRVAKIAARSDGSYIVGWYSTQTLGPGPGGYVRRYASDGTPLDPTEVRVARGFGNLAVLPDDSAFVVWTDGSNGSGVGIWGRRITAANAAIDAADRPLSSAMTNSQFCPSVALHANGHDAMVAWDGAGEGDDWGIFTSRIRLKGPPVAKDDVASTLPGTPTTVNVLANDGDPDPGDVLSVTAASATLGSVSINPDKTLTYTPPAGCGTASDTIAYTIADVTGSPASASVAVSIATGPSLLVTPGSGGRLVGQVGGPFTPASVSYTLSNPCGAAVSWTAAANQTWLDVTPPGGSLPVGQTTAVTITPNSAANALAVNAYAATLSLTNTTNGIGTTSRQIDLEVHPAASILASVLPVARSVQVGNAATAFATVINTSGNQAITCAPAKPASPAVPAVFAYQTTNAANQLVGAPNVPATIAAGGTQSFVFALTPTSAIGNVELPIVFDCANSPAAPSFSGLNTLSFTASAAPAPDMIAIASTLSGNGIVALPGSTGASVFSAAAINIGAPGTITAAADDNGRALPVGFALCQTDAATGACINPTTPGPTATASLAANEVATYSIFVSGTGTVAFDPALNRLFLRLRTSDGVPRGATSVAVRTQ